MKVNGNSEIDILLVGYENQENLGLRSIMAYLLAHGYKVIIVPYLPGHEAEVLASAREFNPHMIGFSLIFQYTLDEFGKLMHYLRANNVSAHFTAGGHFPSLRPKETLELLPELDSIVRFEGELTLLELLEYFDEPQKWKNICGLTFRQNSDIISTPTRSLIPVLDTLPTVYRDQPKQITAGLNMASMLASRGCLFNCSFCSIRQFYGSSNGALRRVRSPRAVVDEMLALFNEKEVRFFSFQDDDFAARTPQQRMWLQEFLNALDKSGLAGQVGWKISCRVDDIEKENLEAMLNHGLMAVYLGVESGNDEGLKTLNKHVVVKQNLLAIKLLKSYNIALAIGFMLFDPSSTMETVRKNILFMREIDEDGYFPINFCKMLPYAGTPIEKQLRDKGLLKGSLVHPDYDFLDPLLNWYEFLVQRIFTRRNFHPEGIVSILQKVDFDCHLDMFFRNSKLAESRRAIVRELIRKSNESALDTLEILLDEIISSGIETLLKEQETLLKIAEQEWRVERAVESELVTLFEEKDMTGIPLHDEYPAGINGGV